MRPSTDGPSTTSAMISPTTCTRQCSSSSSSSVCVGYMGGKLASSCCAWVMEATSLSHCIQSKEKRCCQCNITQLVGDLTRISC
jgi:hypothetical protein